MIVHVGPMYWDFPDRFDRKTGYQYRCEACDWRSPVMKVKLGAERQEQEHRLDVHS